MGLNVSNIQFIPWVPQGAQPQPPVALNQSFESRPLVVYQVYAYTIQATITGVPDGNMFLQCCDDPYVNTYTPEIINQIAINWTSINRSTFAVTDSDEPYTWNVVGAAYNYVRLVYIDNSGNTSLATMTARFNAKG